MMHYRPSHDAVMTVLVTDNPKRPGSQARRRFDRYKTGMTVEEFLDAGGLLTDIYYDIGHGFIAVSDYPYREVLEAIEQSAPQGGANAQSAT